MEPKSKTKGLADPCNEDTVECSSEGQGRIFHGVRFFLVGFDPSAEIQYCMELENGGGFNVGRYDTSCTHVIVHHLTYDDPICLTARKDKKILVTDWWVADSLDIGLPADPARILYRPVKDFGGIPGSKSLCLCLTGYQSQDRSDIMRMVEMMGARFTKPLIAKEVTHLICYKFEGDKYKLAKQMGLKLINHRWLEDCLDAWTLLPEDNYQKSGWELELLEAEAGDSEDDGVGKIGSPTPSRQTIKPGSLFRSPRKSLGTLNSTPLQVNKKKLSMPKSLPKVFAEANSVGEQNINKEIIGVQSKVTPGSTKCDLGSLFQKKDLMNGDLNGKANEVNLNEAPSIDLYVPYQEEGTGIKLLVAQKERDYNGGVVLTQENSPASAVRAFDVTRTGRIERSVGSAQVRNILGETSKDDVKSLLAVENKASPRLVPSSSGYTDDNVQLRDREDGQLKTSEKTKMQTCKDGLSLGSDSVLNKVMMTDVGSNLFNISSNIDDVFGTGKTVRPPEEISKQSLVSKNNILLGNDGVSNFGIGNPADSVDRNEQKSCDVVSANGLSSGFVTPNADSRHESSVGEKRQYKSKGFASNKKKKTMSGGMVMSIGKTMPLGSEISRDEEMHKLELSAEKENLDDGMSQMNNKGDKGFKMCSQSHASRSLPSKAPNGTTLLSIPTNDISVLPKKRGRNQGTNKKAVVDKTLILDVDIHAKKEGAEHTDLNMPNGTGTSCNLQEKLVADEDNEVSPDLIFDAAQLKSDALNDHQQHLNEGSSATAISDQKIISSNILAEKPQAIATSEIPQKRGRSSSKKGKFSEIVDKFNSMPKDAEDEEKDKAALIQVRVNNCMDSVSGAAVSQVESPNELLKNDILSTPRTANRGTPDSTNQLSLKTRLGKLSYASNVQQSNDNKTLPQHSRNLYPDSSRTFDVDHDRQVSGNFEQKPVLETKDVKHFELETPQNNVGKALQSNQIKNKRKIVANGKSGASKKKNSKSIANITDTNETNLSGMDEEPPDSMQDKKQKASIVKRTPKVKRGKLAKREIPTKAAKRSRQAYENGAVKEDKDVNQVAKQENSVMVSRSEPKCFLLSGHRLQRKEFQQLVKNLGGKLLKDSHNWSYQATHLVVPEPLRRTEKFFAAVAAGRWVLTTDYLTASKQAGRFLNEQEYEWHKSGLNEDGTISFEAPRKWRLLREKTGHGAFHGFRIIVYGECIAPSLDTLKRVVKAGGGLILATSPPYTRSLAAGVHFAVISPGISRDDIWIQEFLGHNIACVLVDYLVEYVCKPSYPLDKHVLFNTHGAVEKLLKSMEMNIQSALSNSIHQLTPQGDSGAQMKVREEVKDEHVSEITCAACGSVDRDDVMLLCGDEQGRGCGIAMHIDCCQPPLEEVPEQDWFCFKCKSLTDYNFQKAKYSKKS
ncbi:BRCT domain-containing protein At4g02110 isoform X2 [Cryptomeria japonica]|uniref:BRCT domain-containing protein At4g02110 isoform X2 n=1 Tax=Cryptomeria japonica TaxID=3369 RepID=UPI0027DA92B4|nr:BRCT domain-containing protein At4g02110 isoform X2 [Cryptomeria japonica]